jgi:hypothetical protein
MENRAHQFQLIGQSMYDNTARSFRDNRETPFVG